MGALTRMAANPVQKGATIDGFLVGELLHKGGMAALRAVTRPDILMPILMKIPAMLEGRIKALYIVGENPLVTDPDLRHVEAALKKLDVFIVQDIFLTQTAKNATLVLPGHRLPAQGPL